MKREIPRSLYFGLRNEDLVNRGYIKELDFIKKHMSITHLGIGVGAGISLQNKQQCHKALKELTEYAHSLGIKVCLRLVVETGFYNCSVFSEDPVDRLEMFPIPEPDKAEAIVNDIELVADENGFVQCTHTAVGARKKFMPVYSQVLKAYAFEKTAEGFYKDGTLVDVTDEVNITDWRTYKTSFTLNLGKENAGKNVFVLLAWFYNITAVTDDWEKHKRIIDDYSDIPLDGVIMDEYGYILLNTGPITRGQDAPFGGRIYSMGMKKKYSERWNIDLDRLLFDMRYAPESDESVRIKAINTYFEKLRVFPLEVEKKVYDYTKEVFGEDAYVSCHNTFHNVLDSDEVWRTAANWWDIPRDIAHTDENIPYPVRLGIMMACRSPIDIDMYYNKVSEKHYTHMIEGAPFGTREWHHSYRDFTWGSSFTEPDFLKDIKKIDDQIARLDPFQTEFPKTDLLIVFGAAAQNNWYPDYSARSVFDIDGTLQIVPRCREIWNAGYISALAPDYAIEDGRITLDGDKVSFNGHKFKNCLFLYPKYAKKSTYEFLNRAYENGVNIASIGKSGIDFDGNEIELSIPKYDTYDLSVLEKMGVEKNRFDGGCIYEDGSFSLVNMSILSGEPTEFDLTVDGVRYTGVHTGLLAYRKDKFALATKGSRLLVNGVEAELECE